MKPIKTFFYLALLLALNVVGAMAQESAKRFTVCLVSGVEEEIYRSAETLKTLKSYLEKHYPMDCPILQYDEAQQGFSNIETLKNADSAVFFVRRKTPNAENMKIIKAFIESGKGFVALRNTSHAFENWPTFDVDVLGAKYLKHFGDIDTLQKHPHPIWKGVEEFSTGLDMYNYSDPNDDLTVILEGTNAKGTKPIAWTRRVHGGRMFYLGLGHVDEFEKESFLKLIANGTLWVLKQEI